jgi:hypothetical protein
MEEVSAAETAREEKEIVVEPAAKAEAKVGSPQLSKILTRRKE